MERARVAIWLVALLVAGVVGQSQSGNGKSAPDDHGKNGTICVLRNSPDPPSRISPWGEYNPATLTVRIDNRQPILWPHKRSIKIENLSLDERHLVVLTSDGKRIQSLWFRFSEKETRLCLYFDGCQGVQLGNEQNALWCKCK
jgi:hypothetical protein